MPETDGRKPFDIGLVMAGAISAGAYTAGVCDFLIQALDAWETAKADPSARVPRHQVRIKALTGASAGASTLAVCGCTTGAVRLAYLPPALAMRKIVSISSWPLKRALFSSTHLSHTGLPATRWNSSSCAGV